MLQDTAGEKLKDNLYWQNRFFCLYGGSGIEEILTGSKYLTFDNFQLCR